MDLSDPLATVAPTLDAGVLQVLSATTAACTAAEVHRRLGRGSDEGVRKVLARLVAQGVVLVETPARYPIYLLNREHVAVPHIVKLSNVRDEIVERLRLDVDEWAIAPLHAGLFGSFARGVADADSDIDVILVRPQELTDDQEGTWQNQLDTLGERIRAWTGNDAQVIDLTTTTLGRMARDDDSLVLSWRADIIDLHGERFLDLLRKVR